jgi:hypothetical protein
MIANTNAERCGDPPQAGGDRNSLPREVEEGIDRERMIDDHDDAGKPIDPIVILGCFHPMPSFRDLLSLPRMRQG